MYKQIKTVSHWVQYTIQDKTNGKAKESYFSIDSNEPNKYVNLYLRLLSRHLPKLNISK